MEYPIGTTYEFNQKVSQKHKKYDAEIEQITRHLVNDSSTITDAERAKLYKRIDELRNKIFNLVPAGRRAFKEYADRMLNHTAQFILTDNFLTQCVINWKNIDTRDKERFGSVLLAALDEHYRETDASVTFSIIGINKDDSVAYYDWRGHIFFQRDEILLSTPNEFIGALLHEFMHYLCDKHPNKSYLGPQMSFISARHYLAFMNGPQTAKQLNEYKNQPFERYSYAIQDYVNNSDFTKHLLTSIAARHARANHTSHE